MNIEIGSTARASANISTGTFTVTEQTDNVNSEINKEDMQQPVQAIFEQEDLAGNLSEQLQDEKGREEFQKSLDAAQQVIFGNQTHFQFKVHKETGVIMVKVIDNQTDKVIREIPPEKFLNVIAGIKELAGLIVDKKA